MISINQVQALLRAQINLNNLTLSESEIIESAQRIRDVIAGEMEYPDWDTRDEIIATIQFEIAKTSNNESFIASMTDELISLAKKAERCGWFVGAMYGKDDQLPRFLDEGIWQNGYEDKYLDLVRSMAVGDRIAIKSAYTKKRNLPFDNQGHFVSVMAIKAIGTIVRNMNDGQTVEVEWDKAFSEPREWYFYTGRSTIWKVDDHHWMSEALLDFTFDNRPQDYKRFCEAPYWKERFSQNIKQDTRFKWTRFYEAFASALRQHQDNRTKLTQFVTKLAEEFELSYIHGKNLKDICPFTVMGIFNRGMTEQNRKAIAETLALFLGVDESLPESFEGIPVLNNQKSWFFAGEHERQDTDIDHLWSLFSVAQDFSDEPNDEKQQLFIDFYNNVSAQKGVGWNLSMGLYWIRPWHYLPLDAQSRSYFASLGLKLDRNGAKGRCSGADYLKAMEDLDARFNEEKFPVNSFPEFSLKAWQIPVKPEVKPDSWKALILERIKALCCEQNSETFTREQFHHRYLPELKSLFPENNSPDMTIDRQMQILRDEHIVGFLERGQYEWYGFEEESEPSAKPEAFDKYSVDEVIQDGCFLGKREITALVKRLRDKKNLILQGAPGTGKTWLAKRLAFALIGEKRENHVTAVQFHPNLSYEDFIRGWRPTGDGQLSLCDGPFLDVVKQAKEEPQQTFVIVIEEINRGNPAQIFGEMLTLLEADKRTPNEALSLSYSKDGEEKIFIPGNLYVIGTMNIADRSLALVDLALRRRFAFINLTPALGDTWRRWVMKENNIDESFLRQIESRLIALNQQISDDPKLGKQFQIGHSYVTPSFHNTIEDPNQWFKDVVETEIYPLLEEYWFDSMTDAKNARKALLEGL
ncbi:5-methylcytosine-specific restriction enzyme B [Vibrio aerogenes CECT 7868]|uniref:5-methylcytosine-specific restriction enzyme B n=1 Tax=Vibrio aerogenes CECT 7868 TaxID=1216006 RepID=A0A1M5ZS67_9VIBR|nr:AAA family ATPase [Vibrio aerogenes]SHI27064.1 5-methylcytosine-specific restriction enzyme B [Vibrio aerogenes CECT 7868]